MGWSQEKRGVKAGTAEATDSLCRTLQNHPSRLSAAWALFTVRDLGVLPLGTDYPQVGFHVAEVVERVSERGDAKPWLVMDATGVGVAVADIIWGYVGTNAWVSAATFVAGDTYRGGYGSAHMVIGKTWMLGRLQALLQLGRIRLPAGEDWVQGVVRELFDYEIRQSQTGVAVTGAFGSAHDDRVTALGLACLEDVTQRQVQFAAPLFR